MNRNLFEHGIALICLSFFLVLMLFLNNGCSTIVENPAEVPTKVEVPEEIKVIPITKGWFARYETQIASELKKVTKLKDGTLIKHGEHHFRYNSSVLYWQKFYKSLAAAESTFNPFDTYHETTLGSGGVDNWAVKKGFKDTTYWSMGLFQFSYSDSEYYGCNFDWKKDRLNDMKDHANTIFIPSRQIECAVKIMERLLKKNGTPFFDYRHYWIVLKPGPRYEKYHKNFLYYYNKWVTRELR